MSEEIHNENEGRLGEWDFRICGGFQLSIASLVRRCTEGSQRCIRRERLKLWKDNPLALVLPLIIPDPTSQQENKAKKHISLPSHKREKIFSGYFRIDSWTSKYKNSKHGLPIKGEPKYRPPEFILSNHPTHI
uniref:Uncharacterized protein n=1 Tax=Lepeophtheirus salmonis TaxID=72036 RepID=A0A0K2ULH3_LEPSM